MEKTRGIYDVFIMYYRPDIEVDSEEYNELKHKLQLRFDYKDAEAIKENEGKNTEELIKKNKENNND